MTTTVRRARRDAETRLADAGLATPDVDAAWLVRHVLGWDGARLASAADEPMPADAAAQLDELVTRRGAREPLQLLLGSVGFRYLELRVRRGVFVPRPETEVLAGEAIARMPHGGVVVEPCTGTGAVAVAVATEAAPGEVHATDADAAAVRLARENAAAHGADVTVHHGDLLAPLPAALRGRVDVLVSNPPYVATGEVPDLPPEVADWDPEGALVAGPTGHEVSDRILAEASDWLIPGGWVLVEVAESRARAAARRASAAGLTGVEVVHDLVGRERIVVARRPHAGKTRGVRGSA